MRGRPAQIQATASGRAALSRTVLVRACSLTSPRGPWPVPGANDVRPQAGLKSPPMHNESRYPGSSRCRRRRTRRAQPCRHGRGRSPARPAARDRPRPGIDDEDRTATARWCSDYPTRACSSCRRPPSLRPDIDRRSRPTRRQGECATRVRPIASARQATRHPFSRTERLRAGPRCHPLDVPDASRAATCSRPRWTQSTMTALRSRAASSRTMSGLKEFNHPTAHPEATDPACPIASRCESRRA